LGKSLKFYHVCCQGTAARDRCKGERFEIKKKKRSEIPSVAILHREPPRRRGQKKDRTKPGSNTETFEREKENHAVNWIFSLQRHQHGGSHSTEGKKK